MRLPLPAGRILVYGKPVDMRKGFDGLAALVKQTLKEDPLSGDLFLFLSRSGKLAKAYCGTAPASSSSLSVWRKEASAFAARPRKWYSPHRPWNCSWTASRPAG
jgi:hypothetical protein